MAQETETEADAEAGTALELDREQYVPDWIVEEVVSLALQTQLREPILAAVNAADVDGSSDGESIDVEAVSGESTDEADESGGGRLRGVVALFAVAVGLFVAYRLFDRQRD